MQDEVKTENADSVENTAIDTVQELTNMTSEDFVKSRLDGQAEETPEAEATEQPQEEVHAEVEEQSDVLSQVDLDDMSEEELKELSEKLGSRAVARFGELTAKRKLAEEKAAALEKQLSQRKQPEYSEEDIQNNPYKDITNPKDIQAKAKELNDVIEWAEEILFDSDSYSPSDVVTSVDGRDLTKKDVRSALMNARKNKQKFLPMQAQRIRQEIQGVQLKKSFEERATQELDWMSAEGDNEVKAKYEAMIKDPRLTSSLKSASPELKAQLPYLLAHAANSLYGRRVLPQVGQPAKAKAQLDPPKANSSAATPARTNTTQKKATAYHQQFKNTGESSDFIKLRTLQLSNR
jgi:hypothetical protein